MPLIFLAYRRSDTGPVAGRLSGQLAQRFGDDEVFRDMDDIPTGADWVAESERQLRSSHVLVVLIGPRWLTARGSDGQPRLSSTDDRVRVEIESALDIGIPILPVLVDGTPMPLANELPDSIADLARFNAQPLDDHSFDFHVGRIADAVERLAGRSSVPNLAELMPGHWLLEIHYPNGFTTGADAEFLVEGRRFEVLGSFELRGTWSVDADGHLALEGRQKPRGRKRLGLFQRAGIPYLARIQFTRTGSTAYKGVASTGEWALWTKR